MIAARNSRGFDMAASHKEVTRLIKSLRRDLEIEQDPRERAILLGMYKELTEVEVATNKNKE